MSDLDVELPKAVIKRIVKAKLAEKERDGDQEPTRDFQVNKDAVTAFSHATKVFITYVTTAANDICRENRRTTVAPQDILQALAELEFNAFIPGLEDRLQEIHNKRKVEKDAAKDKQGPAPAPEAQLQAE